MNNSNAHEKLENEILLSIGSLPEIRVHKRKVGKAIPLYSKFGRPINWGIVGEADIQGWIAPLGKGLAIEVKTGKGTLTENQKKWRTMFEKQGGIYIVGRCVKEVKTIVELEIERQKKIEKVVSENGLFT